MGRSGGGARDERGIGGMEMAQLEEKVCKILAENLSVPEDEVTPESRFQEDLDADSLDLVEAVLALEEEFGVNIPEEEMEGVKTVGQAITLVAQKLGVAA
jgi:acyl carrier protein